ncbi:MAG: response regulator [Candidatus Nitricoxidivorans perseverans]|uniref:Response regulator n=1 Tax=Candidatus Nitricoxidivorans perseverans TaxID=2975601 RepID=A0AA49FK05_9PROT|nr:MAG: response regulator [Candidatus Nitricoxidivorans perseverans]
MSLILIVEDNPTNMKFAVTVLESAGHRVLQATDAATGIRIAHESPPDLIFMDIQLPVMDGLEASRRLKADPATRHIPIYALTAFAMAGDEERVRAAGCDGYLPKPVSYKDLLATADIGPR